MIVVRLNGGLGNQLFQYAFGKSLSIQKNVPFLLDDRYLLDRTPRKKFTFRNYDLSLFNMEPQFYKKGKTLLPYWVYADRALMKLIEKMPITVFKNLYVEPYFQFNPNYLSISNNCYCVGYFQSYKYFEPIKELLIKDLTFKSQIRPDCNQLLALISNTNSVCVHIRKGDFVNHSFHGNVETSYYHKALEVLLTQEQLLNLFIFSDDINWCKANLSFSIPTVFVEDVFAGEKARNQLELMINCKHFIISNSSFAWWAAYLGNHPEKKVIAPLAWLKNQKINTKDITPPSWLRL